MKKISILIMFVMLTLSPIMVFAQDDATCDTDGINEQIDALIATYQETQAGATDAESAIQAANDLQASIAEVTATCADAAVEEETTDSEETTMEEVEGVGSLTEGKWFVDWSIDDIRACPSPNDDIRSRATDRSFMLTVDTETSTIAASDVFTWPPLQFTQSAEGDYAFFRNMTLSDGTPFTYEYRVNILSPTHITGKITNYYSFADCYLSNEFQMTLVDEDITCMVGAENGGNLRAGPGTNNNAMGAMAARTLYDVVGQATGSDGYVWWQFADDTWARSDIVTEIGYCDDVPEVTP
jgi:hypothetical protein